MSSGNNQPDILSTKSVMSPGDWVKVVTQILTLLVGLGGVTAILGIQAKQPSPDKPMPVVVAPVNPATPVVNPNVPLTPVTPAYVTKDEMAKMISDSEARILKALTEQLKAFEQ